MSSTSLYSATPVESMYIHTHTTLKKLPRPPSKDNSTGNVHACGRQRHALMLHWRMHIIIEYIIFATNDDYRGSQDEQCYLYKQVLQYLYVYVVVYIHTHVAEVGVAVLRTDSSSIRNVLEGVVRMSAIAASVSVVPGAVNQLLLTHVDQLVVNPLVLSLQSSCGCKGPARPTRTLILDLAGA